MTNVLIVDDVSLYFQKNIISDVVVLCNQKQARVIKDRMGKAFNFSTSEAGLLEWIGELSRQCVITRGMVLPFAVFWNLFS
jgi:hypothetical protein